MSRYSFNIEGILKLVPNALRKCRLTLFLQALLMPIKSLYKKFLTFKKGKDYRLDHSGQVFSLRNIIREYCGDERCDITDGEYINEIIIPYDAEGNLVNYQVNVPYDINVRPQVNVTYAGFGQIQQHDFFVSLPEELQGSIDEAGLRTLIDEYKISGKEYKIVYE